MNGCTESRTGLGRSDPIDQVIHRCYARSAREYVLAPEVSALRQLRVQRLQCKSNCSSPAAKVVDDWRPDRSLHALRRCIRKPIPLCRALIPLQEAVPLTRTLITSTTRSARHWQGEHAERRLQRVAFGVSERPSEFLHLRRTAVKPWSEILVRSLGNDQDLFGWELRFGENLERVFFMQTPTDQ